MSDEDTKEGGWSELLDELDRRKAAARAMGGDDKLARRRADGRLDARQRIERLTDAGSFREIGTLVGSVEWHGKPAAPADALVGGTASIDGRPVVVGSEDFTVHGGSIGIGTHAKRVRLAQLALQERRPLIMLLEGAGERATNAFERYPYAPNDLQVLAELSGHVPTIAAVMGASAGHGALTALLMDLVVMVEGASLFSAGPPLVAAALGEKVSKEELGGARMHVSESGVGHNLVADDDAAFDFIRDYLGYFPTSAWQRPPRVEHDGTATGQRVEKMLEVVPRDLNKAYDVRDVIALLADGERYLEIQPDHGRSIVTALARLDGRPVAVVANQPRVMAGSVTAEAADKAAHFIELVGSFHFPVVFLADNPGVMAGRSAERAGTLRSAARMYAAQAALRSPKLHVTLRKAFGFGSSLMAMNPFDRQSISLALPGATLGGTPAAGGSDAARVSDETRAALGSAESEGALRAADNMSYDEVIDPRDLRSALLAALHTSAGREDEPPAPLLRPGIRP